MLSIKLTKSQLRQELRAKRKSFVQSLSDLQRDAIYKKLAQNVEPLLANAETVALYMPTGAEISPLLIKHHNICLPFVYADSMLFKEHQQGMALVSNKHGIKQPIATATTIAPTHIIVPLIGFDESCNRLGQGGGYYDRALAGIIGAVTIGVAYECQKVPHIPIQPHDKQLDYVVTQSGVYKK